MPPLPPALLFAVAVLRQLAIDMVPIIGFMGLYLGKQWLMTAVHELGHAFILWVGGYEIRAISIGTAGRLPGSMSGEPSRTRWFWGLRAAGGVLIHRPDYLFETRFDPASGERSSCLSRTAGVIELVGTVFGPGLVTIIGLATLAQGMPESRLAFALWSSTCVACLDSGPLQLLPHRENSDGERALQLIRLIRSPWHRLPPATVPYMWATALLGALRFSIPGLDAMTSAERR